MTGSRATGSSLTPRTCTSHTRQTNTLADPQHKNEWQYKELSDTLAWSREIKTMLTSVNARSALWDAAEFSG
jgi:hypothetical protein